MSTILNDTDIMDATKPVILSPTERINRFGIECVGPAGDGIVFKAGHWKTGGEYIQKLIVRNVSTTVKKLKYKLPSTRYFSMAYPEVIVLSPGMFTEIDVVFRPVEMNPYDDTIYMKMQEGVGSGGFHVPVKALISKLVVSAPFGVDLGYCATHQTTSLIFQLTNVGEVDAPFSWQSPYPFVLEPSEGIIPVGEKQDIKVSIFPQDGTVYVSQAVCSVGEGVHAIIPEPTLVTRLSAIGKYAYIVLSENVVDFGEVLVGTEPESIPRDVLLRNNSVVPAEYELIRHDEDRDEVFDVYPKSGVIPALSSITVNIRFKSLAFGMYSLDRYSFVTPGQCSTTLTCSGFSLQPHIIMHKESTLTGLEEVENVTISDAGAFFDSSPPNSLNFRDAEVGFRETRILFIKNTSSRPITFSIQADPQGIFQIEPRQATIPALLEGHVKFTFVPLAPINYYRRVFVLFNNALPQFIDVMGTGYIRAKGEIKEQRPAPLRHAHVQAFRNRAVQGLSRLNPDELDLMLVDGAHQTLMEGTSAGVSVDNIFAIVGTKGTMPMALTQIQNPLTRTGGTSRASVATAHEFFIEDTDLTAREVQVNQTSLDFGYTAFNSYSAAQSVTITNSTNGKISVNWFVPCIGGDEKKREKKVDVTSSVEERRKLQQELELNGPAFSVDPPNVDISAGKSQTFYVTFRPKQSSRNFSSQIEAYVYFKNQRTFRLVNDATMSPPWCLSINASGHTFNSGQLLANAAFSGAGVRQGKLLFPCCYVNDSIYQTIMLKNTSNLPSTFRLQLGFEEETAMTTLSNRNSSEVPVWSVKPTSGEVAAEDFVLICIRFTPSSVRKFTQLVHCIVNGADGGKLLLEGHGGIPFLTCPDIGEDAEGNLRSTKLTVPNGRLIKTFLGSFFLKPTCIGLSFTRTFTLHNGSRLPLRYKIVVPSNAENIMTITPLKGILRGKEQTKLTIVFAPHKGIKYTFKVKILVYPVGGVAPRVIDARQPGKAEQPELLQQLTVNIVAPADVGTLLFEPQRMTADVRLVGTYETRDFTLQNVSDADIAYELFYKTEFVADTGALTKTSIVTEVMPLMIEKQPGDVENNLFCEFPSGILPARSRTRVSVTFYPSRAGLFEFLVFARIQAIDIATKKPVMLSNEEVALLRVSQVDREEMTVGQGKNGVEGQSLIAFVSGRASFPTMVFEDIRTDCDLLISDVSQLWRQFSLTKLNYDLALPLTEAETILNSSSSPNLSVLNRYTFEFTPDVLGSPRQNISIRIRNSGFLTTSFHIHFPNEKELDLEPWCDEDEPTEEGLMHIAIIEELKCFTVEPREATLKPNESCTLSISYSHSHLKYNGLHSLPILMKLEQGKMFWLDLIGRTLPGDLTLPPPIPNTVSTANGTMTSGGELSAQPSRAQSTRNGTQGGHAIVPPKDSPPNILLFPHTGRDNIYELSPVPIGFTTMEAPKQKMEIVNASGVEVAYDVDLKDVNRLIAENFNLPIVRLSNPKGTIPARSSLYLEWLFYPLEAKMYEFTVDVKYTHANPSNLIPINTGKPNSGRGGTSGGFNGTGTSIAVNSMAGAFVGSAFGDSRILTQGGAPPLQRSLELIVRGQGYDAREPKPIKIETKYLGGIPNNYQLLHPEKQFARLSFDKLEFGLVPQYATKSHLVLLHNDSQVNATEFVVDDSTSSLFAENLLTISPMYGRIEAGSHIVLHVNIKANTQPVIFQERIKIAVRELVKGAVKKHHHKLLDKIRKKTVATEHESVVARGTIARVTHMEHTYVPEGRNASMPVTFNATGQPRFNVTMSGSYVQNGNGAGGEQMIAPQDSVSITQETAGGLGMFNDNASVTSPTRTGTGYGRTPGTAGTGTGTGTSRNGGDLSPKSRDSRSLATASTSGNRTGAGGGRNEPPVLLGPPSILILRISGDIFSLENVQSGGILNRKDNSISASSSSNDTEESKGSLSQFIIPSNLPFVPWRHENRVGNAGQSEAISSKADRRSTMRDTPSTNELNSQVADKSSTGMQHNSSTPALKVASALPRAREVEFRSITNFISDDLFKCLVSSAETEYHVCKAVMATSSGLRLPEELDDGASTLEGIPVHGLYYNEIKVASTDTPVGGSSGGATKPKALQRDTSNMTPRLEHHDDMTEDEMEAKAGLLLLQPDFKDMVTDIMHNTMFNLMQEASFGEFPVNAEPLRFAIKRQPEPTSDGD